MPPVINQTGLYGVAFEFAGKADTITAAFDAMRAADATAEIRSAISGLRCALFGEIVFRQPIRIGHKVDVATATNRRSFQGSSNTGLPMKTMWACSAGLVSKTQAL